MLFNSYIFIFIFLPIVFFGFYQIGKHSHALACGWLALASLFFYGWWDIHYVPLLLSSIAFNYIAGYFIGHQVAQPSQSRSKVPLAAAITANLGLLGYFKYANFFVENLNSAVGASLLLEQIVLPLGISFFTFTQIAFLVDTYQSKVKEYNFVHYALFVTYFPHLIAGPVLHHKEMMPQFAERKVVQMDLQNVAVGVSIFVLGLTKKVWIADSLARYATPVFSAVAAGSHPMLMEAWVGALAYTLQLYFDFSAYSDMAIGLSLMFNVRLPMNFNSPYKATNIIDFWRRWHMTLSRFLRDYLYIPLGGNRHGKAQRYVNLTLTMVLGGFWHGAGWTFVIWGALHGIYLMINHAWQGFAQRMSWGDGGKLGRFSAGTLTFLAVVIGWVFFRADSVSSAISMLQSMIGKHGVMDHWVPVREALKVIIPSLLCVFLLPNLRQIFLGYRPTCEDLGSVARATGAASTPGVAPPLLQWRPSTSMAWVIAACFLLSVGELTKVSEFLYFQF